MLQRCGCGSRVGVAHKCRHVRRRPKVFILRQMKPIVLSYRERRGRIINCRRQFVAIKLLKVRPFPIRDLFFRFGEPFVLV